MIAYLEGTVRLRGSDYVVVQVGGIGYQVFPVGCALEVGSQVRLDIFDLVREDRRELFGFCDPSVHRLFLEIIGISGFGPKLAQKILNAVPFAQMMQYIEAGDVGLLTEIPGIGKKNGTETHP